MYEDYLVHHGIKGMKWGIRRFQNKDGTLTEAGKRRLSTGKNPVRITSDNRVHPDDAAKAYNRLRSEAATDFQGAASIAREGGNITREVGKLAKNRAETARLKKIAKKQSKMDLSDVTDEDLNRMINRLNLEQRYKDLSTKNVEAGKMQVDSMLQTIGGLLAIGVSAAGILASIEEMKK